MADEADTTTDDSTTETTETDTSTVDTATEDTESAQTEAKEESKDTTDWKAMARKHEARAKENAAAAKELAALKKSQMSEQEKVQAAAQEATERAEAAERRAALAEAAITHGLTKDDLELLDGVPADQIEDRAKKLAARLKKAAPAASSGNEVGGKSGKKTASSLESAVAGYYA